MSSMETGSFGGGGNGDFNCGGIMCTRQQWCLDVVSASGNGSSVYCMDYGNCGDCTCIMQQAAAGKCAGYSLTCTPQPPLIVTCEPSTDSGAPPADSGAGG
jgi:hypothetical protein